MRTWLQDRLKDAGRNVFRWMANQNLKRLIRRINQAKVPELQSTAWLTGTIRKAGLKYLPTGAAEIYGLNKRYMNFRGPGFFQIPDQLAGAASMLTSAGQIESFIEIGTNNGWTAVFLAAYLRRFNPKLSAATVDIQDYFDLRDYASQELGLSFHCGKTSNDFRGTKWDLVFIDGDHRYDWVKLDWENLSGGARFVMFHDVNDSGRFHKDNEGAVRFWRNLRETDAQWDFHEFFAAPGTADSMGIGIAIRKGIPSNVNSSGQETRAMRVEV